MCSAAYPPGQINRLEGANHQAVAKSPNLSIKKLKKCFTEQS